MGLFSNRTPIAMFRINSKGRLGQALSKLRGVASEETQQEVKEAIDKRAFYTSPLSEVWVDEFEDTVFPEFEKPETWNRLKRETR